MPKASVIIPVHRFEYLSEAIDSILQQTFADFELLIVSDFLDDEGIFFINQYCKRDSRIKLLHNRKNKGIVGALNTGLDEAQGEYVIRMDGDDISFPERFRKQISFMDKNLEIGICGTWMNTFGDRENKLWHPFPTDHQRIKINLLFYTTVAHPTLIIRKSFMDDFNLRYDENFQLVEDYELWTRAVDCFNFANIKDVLLSYRVHGSGVSVANAERQRELDVLVLKNQLAKLNILPTDDEIRLHRSLYWGPYRQDESFFIETENWFLKLAKANDENNNYCPKIFLSELSKVFFRVCRASLGFSAGVSRFVKSPLVRRKLYQAIKL